jgi:hypothetical protein
MNRLTLAALLLASAASGCSLKPQRSDTPAEAPYVFPHSPHLEGDVACTACHGGIAESTALVNGKRDLQMPADRASNPACKDCHDNSNALVVPPRPAIWRLRIDHKAHLARGLKCQSCHAKLPDPGDTSPPQPTMASCTSCHEHQSDFAAARCMPCHVDLKGYFPKTAFSHQGNWIKVHGNLARPSAESCAACHDQTSCAECHAAQTTAARPSIIFPEEVRRPFIHRGDYVSRHSVDAHANPASCRTCHGSVFCSSCHTQQGVTSAAVNVRDPHPVGWATDRGSNHFHGDAARRDILSCAGCHDNGASATCVGCHQMGGVGGNPHPRAFLRKHDEGDQNKPLCRACHTI